MAMNLGCSVVPILLGISTFHDGDPSRFRSYISDLSCLNERGRVSNMKAASDAGVFA